MTEEDRELRSFVEWGGPVWEQQVAIGLKWLGDLAGMRVLDIGTRYGGMATYLALHGAHVTGLETVAEPLEQARARALALGVADSVNLLTYSGDPADLPKGFDIVFTKSTLVVMPDLDLAAQGIAASLIPGGRLLAVENARGPLPLHIARVARHRTLRPHGAAYFTGASINAIEAHLRVDLIRWTTTPPTVVVGAIKGT